MGSLLNTVKEKVCQGYEWLKAKAQAITGKIQSWVLRYRKSRQAFKKHRKYLNEVLDSKLEYAPEEVDIKLSENLKQRLSGTHGGQIAEYLKTLSFPDRKEYIEKELLPLIASEMGVSPQFLGWYQEGTTLGYYCEKKQGIAINEIYLADDNEFILRFIVNTIIHECKHAMQWDAVSGRHTHGYSTELIEKWKLNIQDYIRPHESDEGYLKQPVEWDASSFAESVQPTE